MKVAICDEDRESCVQLRSLIQSQEPHCEVACFCRREQLGEAEQYFDCLIRDVKTYQSDSPENTGKICESAGQLLFQTKSRNYTVQREEILYVESRKRKVEIHVAGTCFSVYATMKGMEQRLGEPFFRCHRGYLVNMAYVAEYDMGGIRLKNGERVYLAREKYSDFAKAYIGYLKQINEKGYGDYNET
ncbi:MAG: LytTR family transcriptional regulator DNA-binding domain-containing protein [Acetatifactor sp.]|nr:LytTR family transcriptional regulator DNA-binding domain-containing protein [Acetatifactor sp.]